MKRSAFILALAFLPTSALAQPLAVYVLAGQSNMEGHAKVETFAYIGDDPKTAPLLAKMRMRMERPAICDDVWISYLTGGPGGERGREGAADRGLRCAPSAGRGRRQDRSRVHLRPHHGGGDPGADPHHQDRVGRQVACTPTSGLRPPAPTCSARASSRTSPKRGIDVEKARADKVAATGRYYRLMIEHVKRVLADVERVCPGYDPKAGYELAGFVWFQGWNDMVDRGTYPDRDRARRLRRLQRVPGRVHPGRPQGPRAPELPFVIGVMGVGGPIAPEDAQKRRVHRNFREAMAAPAALPEFRGTVVAVRTAPFWDAAPGRHRCQARRGPADGALPPQPAQRPRQRRRQDDAGRAAGVHRQVPPRAPG